MSRVCWVKMRAFMSDLGRYGVYAAVVILFALWLHIKGWLVPVIAVLSVAYLLFYFGIGTLAVFMVSLEELGPLVQETNASSPLLTVVVLGPLLLVLWVMMLAIWPVFMIPDRNLVRNPDKYDAIEKYESLVREKYH